MYIYMCTCAQVIFSTSRQGDIRMWDRQGMVVLQCVAVCCIPACRSVLQCFVVCCIVLQCVHWAGNDIRTWDRQGRMILQYVAVCCSVLQCAAVCWIVLQCVAECCSVLQYVAVCCSEWEIVKTRLINICKCVYLCKHLLCGCTLK